MCVHSVLGAKRIARQYWRAWIETSALRLPSSLRLARCKCSGPHRVPPATPAAGRSVVSKPRLRPVVVAAAVVAVVAAEVAL